MMENKLLARFILSIKFFCWFSFVVNTNIAQATSSINSQLLVVFPGDGVTTNCTDPARALISDQGFVRADLPTSANFADNTTTACIKCHSQSGAFNFAADTPLGLYLTNKFTNDNAVTIAEINSALCVPSVLVNSAPVLDLIGSKNINEGETLQFTLTANDPNFDALTMTMSPLPGSTLQNNGNGSWTFSWTPDFSAADTYPVRFTVTDDGDPIASDFEDIIITVNDVNRAPVLNPIGAKTVQEGVLLTFTVSASDVDLDTLTQTVSSLPLGATFIDNNDNTGSFSWLPDFGTAGNYLLTFTTTDNGNPMASDVEQVTITVGDVNRPPVLNPIGSKLVQEGETLVFTVTATDPDLDALVLSSSILAGATFVDNGNGTGTYNWTPGFGTTGNYTVIFTVTDTGNPMASDFEEININVGDVNRPPVLTPLGSKSIQPDNELTFTVIATDPDLDNLALSTSALPLGAIFTDLGDGTGVFRWTPMPEQEGNYNLIFTVTDNGNPVATDFEEITITVGNVNMPPVLNPIGAQLVKEGSLMKLTITTLDLDSDSITILASALPLGASFVDNGDGTATLTWMPEVELEGNFSITITVLDDGTPVISDFEVFNIAVGDINQPPILNPIGTKLVLVGDTLTIPVVATDPDLDTLNLTASPLPIGATFNDNLDGTGEFVWTPVAGDIGNHTMLFKAIDNGLPMASDSEEVTIGVNLPGANINNSPVLTPLGNQTAIEEQPFEFSVTATDLDAGDNLVTTVTPLPQGAIYTDNADGTGTFNWIPEAGSAGNYNLTISVTDDGIPMESDSEQMTITVNAIGALTNNPPTLNPIGNQTVTEGELLEFGVFGNDLDPEDMLSFKVSPIPVGATFTDLNDGTATFSWTPDEGSAGDVPLTFSVEDNAQPPVITTENIIISVQADRMENHGCDPAQFDNVIMGTSGDDSLEGTPDNDIIYGLAGNDTISGGGGDDCIDGGLGNDEIFGDRGNDIIMGGGGMDVIEGGSGDDKILGGSGNDRILGELGNDELKGGSGHDRVKGGKGDDDMEGGSGNDRLSGEDGNDVVNGGDGDDQVGGDEGNDQLQGGSGDDELEGESGIDSLNGGPGFDMLDGGLGNDECTEGEKVRKCEI